MVSYKDAGIDNDAKRKASKILYDASRKTWATRKGRIGEIIVPYDDFSGLRYVRIGNLPLGTCLGAGNDGIGTKIDVGERTGDHSTMAYNLIEMVAGDALVRGGEPVLVLSTLDTNRIKNSDIPLLEQIAEGYVNASIAADVSVMGGEFAELGKRVGGYSCLPNIFNRIKQSMNYIFRGEFNPEAGFNYNWGATAIWFAREDRLFTGKEIKKWDYLVGLGENGFRSNGLSLPRKIGEKVFGRNWHEEKLDNQTLGKLVLTPSVVYTKAVCEMFGGYDREPKANVHGVVHVTGEGIPGKLKRVLQASGFGAEIDNPLNPPEIMLYMQELGNVNDREAYNTWNMGQGMIIITPEPMQVMDIARKYNINSDVIGRITPGPELIIKNKGYYRHRKSNLIF